MSEGGNPPSDLCRIEKLPVLSVGRKLSELQSFFRGEILCRLYSAMEKSEEENIESVQHCEVCEAGGAEKAMEKKTYIVRHVTKDDEVRVYKYGGEKKARSRISDDILIARHKVAKRITRLKNLEDIQKANDALSTVFGQVVL